MLELFGLFLVLCVIWGVLAIMGALSRLLQPSVHDRSSTDRPVDRWAEATRILHRLREDDLLSEENFCEMVEVLRDERIRVRTEKIVAPAEEEQRPKPVAETPAEPEEEFVVLPVAEPDENVAATVIPAPAKPRRGRILQAFMEEKNIRWGELISAMLIVGSAIGLVISLWSTLANAIPYFPALLFMLGTGAIHLAGLYTLKRWNLKSTSRGLLLISTLLIPLNFLAAIALAGQPGSQNYVAASEPIYVIAVAIGLIGYGAIAFSTGRVFRRRHWWVFWPAVMIPSAAQLLIARQGAPGLSAGQLNLLAMPILLGFVFAIGSQLRLASAGARFSRRRAEHSFQTLGVGLFSAAMAFGLLVSKSEGWPDVLADLAPASSLLFVLVTSMGMLVHRRATAPELANLRTAGTSVAAAGVIFLLISLAFAWPRPDLLVALGLVDAIALTVLALASRIPALHVPAIAAFSLAAVTGLHWFQGTIGIGTASRELIPALMTGRSALLLTGIAAISFLLSLAWKRTSRGEDSRAYRIAAGFVGLIGLLVAFAAGYGTTTDVALATPVFAIAAVVLLVIAIRLEKIWAVWTGIPLVFVALSHTWMHNKPAMSFLGTFGLLPWDPVHMGMLVASSLAALLSIWLRRRGTGLSFATELALTAILGSSLAAIAALLGDVGADFRAGYLVWIAVIFGGLSQVAKHRGLFIAAQCVMFLAVLPGAVAISEAVGWSNNDARFWQLLFAMLSVVCLISSAARQRVRGAANAKWLGKGERNVDHTVLGISIFGLGVLTILGTAPGIAAEFPTDPNTLAVGSTGVLGLILVWLAGVASVVTLSLSAPQRWRIPLALGGALLLGRLVLSTNAIDAEQFESTFGVSHLVATGWGQVAAIAIALAALVTVLRERVTTSGAIGLAALATMIPGVIAAQSESVLPVSTTLRFGLAAVSLLAVIGFCFRSRLRVLALRLGFAKRDADAVAAARVFVFALAMIPVLAISLFAARTAAGGGVFAGSEGLSVGLSYGLPLWLFAIGLAACAVKERCERTALAAAISLQAGIAMAVAMTRWTAGDFGVATIIEMSQWFVVGLAACGLIWRMIRRTDQATTPAPLAGLEFATVGIAGLLCVSAVFGVVASPYRSVEVLSEFGSGLSLVGFALASALVLLRDRRWWPVCAMAIVPLLAGGAPIMAQQLEIVDEWFSLHVLVGGWVAVMVICAGAALARGSTIAKACAFALAGVTVSLGIATQWDDPQRPAWLLATASAAAAMSAAFGITSGRQRFAYASGGFALLATVAAISRPWIGLAAAPTLQTYFDATLILAIATGCIGLFWLLVEVARQRTGSTKQTPAAIQPVHHSAIALLLLIITSGSVFLLGARETLEKTVADLPSLVSPLGLGFVVALAVLLVASLWDRRARFAVPGLFGLGITTSLVLLDGFNAGDLLGEVVCEPDHLVLGAGLIAAAWVGLTTTIWALRSLIVRAGQSLRASQETMRGHSHWLPMSALVLGCFSAAIAFWAVLWFDDVDLRFAAAAGTGLAAASLAMFAGAARSPVFQRAFLIGVVVAAVQCVWAIPWDATLPSPNGVGLHLAIRLLEVLAAGTLLYAFAAMKLSAKKTAWNQPMQQVAVALGCSALVTLIGVLVIEGAAFPYGEVPITNLQVAVVSMILAGLVVGLGILALMPEHDPLRLSERGRMVYVYAAEVVTALLFLHIFLTKPVLFQGFLRPYWPFIVLGLAFAGVGFAEWARRKNLRVVADPLEKTGVFLPLLPVLDFWLSAGQQFDRYALILLLTGLLFVMLASLRRSFVYSVAAAIFANLSLWAMYHHTGYDLLNRPQLWLIPPGLSLLVAAHWNRDRLSEAAVTGIRYFAMLLIYVSSTAEMFIAGLGSELAPPMILAGLSVVGVLAGMMLRVRAFLFAGTTFLFLSIVSMVWHATAVIEQVWPWWVFGIVVGLALLTLFGLFEKKRNEVLAAIGRMKQWDR